MPSEPPTDPNLPIPTGQGDALPAASISWSVDMGRNITETSDVHFRGGMQYYVVTRTGVKYEVSAILRRYTDTGTLIGQIGIFVAFFLALLTTDPKTLFGYSPDVWRAVLILLTLGSFVWAVVGVVQYLRSPSESDIVEAVLRSDSETGRPSPAGPAHRRQHP